MHRPSLKNVEEKIKIEDRNVRTRSREGLNLEIKLNIFNMTKRVI